LLIGYLAPKLPPNVQLIVTTRREACCGGIEAVLTRTFPNGTTFLIPADVREGDVAGGNALSDQKVMVYDTVVRECGLPAEVLLRLSPKGGVAATLGDLHALYRAVFDARPPTSGSVRSLLNLLMASQEPLSTSLLQQLGMGTNVLQQLPGWDCLFFEAEHQ
jgi:hypothetical protein